MAARRLYHLARADFLERVRRHGFLVALLFCVYAGYAFLPPNPSKYVTLVMDTHRGIYNSAWIGTAVAMLAAAFISLIGFFVVKNAVERDRRTGVGQILATTPISRLQYTLGKTLSNFAVLAAMTTIVALACVVMQFIRAEDTSFDAGKMFVPFALITLPPLLITSALAVLFETMPILRGGIGNVAFIFAWGGILGGNFTADMTVPHNDPMAPVSRPLPCSPATTPSRFRSATAPVSMGANVRDEGLFESQTFVWSGIDWTLKTISWRLSWVFAALLVAGVAAIPFDRFDPARGRASTHAGAAVRRRRRRDKHVAPADDPLTTAGGPASAHAAPDVRLTPLAGARGLRLGAMVIAEFKPPCGLRWW
jgi:hypothetical protein